MIFRILSPAIFSVLLFGSPGFASDYAVIMMGAEKKVGKAIGPTKEAAIASARSDCERVSGGECSTYYGARSTSYMIFMYCAVDNGGQNLEGVVANHSRKSLADARQKALRKVQKQLLRNTYSHISMDDCDILMTYSAGTFSPQ